MEKENPKVEMNISRINEKIAALFDARPDNCSVLR